MPELQPGWGAGGGSSGSQAAMGILPFQAGMKAAVEHAHIFINQTETG